MWNVETNHNRLSEELIHGCRMESTQVYPVERGLEPAETFISVIMIIKNASRL